MSPEQKAIINHRRREAYRAKKVENPSAITAKNREPSRKLGKREYKRRLKDLVANNLHKDSCAIIMNTSFTPKLVFPNEPRLYPIHTWIRYTGFIRYTSICAPIFSSSWWRGNTLHWNWNKLSYQESTKTACLTGRETYIQIPSEPAFWIHDWEEYIWAWRSRWGWYNQTYEVNRRWSG